MKKLDLVGDHGLVRWSVIDVEMIDAWIDAELTFRGSSRCLDCGARLGNLIVRGDTNEPGTVKGGGMLDWTIGRSQQPGR